MRHIPTIGDGAHVRFTIFIPMRKLLTLLVALILSANAISQTTYSRVAIPAFENMYATLGQLGLAMDHTHSYQGRVIVELSDEELQILDSEGIKYSIMIRDVSRHYVEQATAAQRDGSVYCAQVPQLGDPENFDLGSYAGFFKYGELLDHLDAMAEAYPDLITAKAPISDFETHEDRPIYFLKMSDNPDMDEDEPTIMYNAIHHAREPACLSQLVYYMWWLLENYETDPEVQYLIDNTEIFFVPCINPDGYLYNEETNPEGGGMWRKNRRDNQDGTYGVDLNRNYGEYWGLDDIGSSGSTNSNVYRGPEPFSEPETSAIKWLCEQHDFELAFNNHSHGNLLINPGDNEPTGLTQDSTLFRQMGSYLSRFDNYDDGTGIETVGYFANGVADDWMYAPTAEKPKSFTYTPEAGDPGEGFWPPESSIYPICRAYLPRNLDLLRMVHPMAGISIEKDRYFEELQGYATYEITYLGQADGDITVSLTPPLGMVAVGIENVHSGLQAGDVVVDSIAYELGDIYLPGDMLELEVVATAGQFSTSATVEKVYGMEQVLFEDACENFDNWSTWDDQWGNGFQLSNASVSGDHSFTDPEIQPDWNDITAALELNPLIDLEDMLSAHLEFDIQYAINSNTDFFEVMVYSDYFGTWTPMCGYYSERGNIYQSNGPVYDGFKHDWVHESISLDEFIGQEISLGFFMTYSSNIIEDGVYIDNIRVTGISGIDTGVDDLDVVSFELFPNPAIDQVTIKATPGSTFAVNDAVGRVVYQNQTTANSQVLDVSSWARGLYVCRLNETGETVQLIVR